MGDLPVVKQYIKDGYGKHYIDPAERAPECKLFIAVEKPGLVGSCQEQYESEDYMNPLLLHIINLHLTLHIGYIQSES